MKRFDFHKIFVKIAKTNEIQQFEIVKSFEI